jgi:class 3 adenylate cyclase
VAFEKVVTDSWLETALAQLYLSSNASVVPGDPAAPQNTQFQRVFLPAFLTMFHRHYAFSGHRNILVRLNIFGFTYYSPLDSADMPPLASCTADAWGRPIGPYSGPRCQTIDGAEYGIARLNVAGTAGGPAAAVAQLMEWQDGPVHPSIAECTQAGCYPYAFNRGDFRGWYELGARQSNEQHRPMEPDDLPPPYDDASAFFPGCTNFSVFQDAQLSFRHCPWTIHHLRTDEMIPVVLHADGTTASVNNGFGGPADATIVAELWYAKRPVKVVESVQSVLFTLLVILVLGGVSLMLSRDAETMAIRPIERMVDAVTRLAANPALKLEAVAKVEYETDALYASLIKISSLLQVGFGEAGNNLVAENLKRGDTVDPMVPGKVIKGAFGFCIIDDYEEVLECLGEEILPFTNTAAGVVHTAVTANGGQANRNLGEAFLCVWKPNLDGLTKGVDYDDAPTPDRLSDLPPLGGKRVQAADTLMCDGALTAFRRSVRTIQSSPKLQAYNQHEEIVKWFDGQYTTQIGYGLNFGWAIEGAVGTSIKIDCSYLSPNVNLAARLESATKMYGVTILMSEYFVDKLSEAARLGLRRLDVVCLKGSSIPMSIYTCDRSNALYCSRPAVARLGAERVVAEFQRVFAKGLDGFVAGEWGRARAALQTALEICPHDKPAQRLMWHMDSRQANPEYGLSSVPFVAPEGWAGYHALLSK